VANGYVRGPPSRYDWKETDRIKQGPLEIDRNLLCANLYARGKVEIEPILHWT